MPNNRSIGASKEELAAEFLQHNGLQILEKNYRSRNAEIDIIALDRDVLVFAEVKFRSGPGMGKPYEAVTVSKQKKISSAAAFYSMMHPEYKACMKRFDVISMLQNETLWIKSAFEFQGNSLL